MPAATGAERNCRNGKGAPDDCRDPTIDRSRLAGGPANFPFGLRKFLGVPDPSTFWDDRDYVHGRFGAEHVPGFAAELEGELVGSNFVTRWGSVGFFGPLTLRPDCQGAGIGKALVEAVSAQLKEWGVHHAGLFTFAHSPLHLALYQKSGFRARFLTAARGRGRLPRSDRRGL